MHSARKSPWRKEKMPNGTKIKYDFQDLNFGITRTRRTFNNVEEAKT